MTIQTLIQGLDYKSAFFILSTELGKIFINKNEIEKF